MKLKAVIPAVAVSLVVALSAQAHHAFSRFDSERVVTLHGTVSAFHWTSPHAWIMLTVAGKGRTEHWAIEMTGASGLAQEGWNPETLTPGMPVTTTVQPLRDGTNGGRFLRVVLPDGAVLGQPADTAMMGR